MFRSTCAFIQSTISAQVRHSAYMPKKTVYKKAHKGKIPVRIGGSTKGSTVTIGDFGLRLKGDGQRISAKQLQTCEAVIRRIIKVEKEAREYMRLACNIAVAKKGNETRMGKGKGAVEYWAARVPMGRIVWEIRGASEELAREAFRQAGNRLPGAYEFVKRGDGPKVGKTTVDLTTAEIVQNPETGNMEMVHCLS